MRLASYNTLAPFLLGAMHCPACREGRLFADGDILACDRCGHQMPGYEAVVQLGPSVPNGGRWHRATPPDLLARFAEVDVDMLEAFLSAWLKPADGAVVDLYGGTGWMARRLARWFGAARVLSLEPDHALAQAAMADVKDPGLAYLSGPLTHLPFRDGTVGGATCMALHRVEDTAGLFRELRRVLAPGGSAALMTPLQADGWVGGVQWGLGMATGLRFAAAEAVREQVREAGLELRALLPSKHLGLLAVRRLM